jgi:hypothetical protein
MQTGVPASMRGVWLFKQGQCVGGRPPSILVPALHNERACHQAQYASLKRAIVHCTGGPEYGLDPEVTTALPLMSWPSSREISATALSCSIRLSLRSSPTFNRGTPIEAEP